MTAPPSNPVLSLVKVDKRFPGVHALKDRCRSTSVPARWSA